MRGALPPGPRDLTLWGQDVQGGGNPETGFPPHPGTEVALRSLPSVALSSTQVENSLPNPDQLCHPGLGNQPLSTLKTHLLSCLADGVHLNPHRQNRTSSSKGGNKTYEDNN
jgi:hypothetical protein